MNILLINLTRFGDLLQMQPIILGLQAQGHRVGLVCLENFAPATVLLRGLDFVQPLAGASILHQTASDWLHALGLIEDMAKNIEKNFPVEYIINTTAILGARLLARRFAMEAIPRLTHMAPIGGFGIDNDGFGVSGDLWSTFLQGASAERLNCPFNLVDMFRASAGLGHEKALRGLHLPSQAVLSDTEVFLAEKMTALQPLQIPWQGFIGFQLGASDARRQWPVESFVALGQELWQKCHMIPILLGSPAERSLATQYEQHMRTSGQEHPCIDAIGSTDIPHLAGILTSCKLLVTNDTGTMHLAAGLDVPVLAIFLATAQAWDTGPYMHNCCCLEPAMPCHPCAFHQPCALQNTSTDEKCKQPCLERIQANDVFTLVAFFLQHTSWPQLPQEHVRIWVTTEDVAGFSSLHSLSGHEKEERSHWLCLQRAFYSHFLDGKEFTQNSLPQDMQFTPSFRQEVGTTLRHASDMLLLLQGQMQLVQQMPSKKAVHNVLSTCQRIQVLLGASKYLKALEHLWRVLSQEHGGNIEHFAKLTSSLKDALMHLMHAVAEKKDNTLL